jgi:hypothetical protein
MRRTHRDPQHGQSTTEFAVLALVLTPLFMLVPLLGKYLDVAQTTTQASRYAAFEISVRGPATVKDEATVAAEARRRLMGTTQAPIKTGDAAGDFAGFRNPLWTDFRGDVFLPRFDQDVTHAAPAESRRVPSAAVAAFAGDAGFRLPDNNLYTARMAAAPRKPRDLPLWDNVDLRMTRQTGILVDGWNAASAAVVRDRIEDAAFPAYPVLPLKLQADTLGQIPALFGEPAMRVGRLDPDIVPCDRLDPPC